METNQPSKKKTWVWAVFLIVLIMIGAVVMNSSALWERAREEGYVPLRPADDPHVSMEFKDADIRIVLDLLGSQSGQKVFLSPSVKGYVNLNVRRVHWKDALEEIIKPHGFKVIYKSKYVVGVFAEGQNISDVDFEKSIYESIKKEVSDSKRRRNQRPDN